MSGIAIFKKIVNPKSVILSSVKETSLFLSFSPGNNLGLLPESLHPPSSFPAQASLLARMRVQEWLCAWTEPQLEACFPLLLLEKLKPSSPT